MHARGIELAKSLILSFPIEQIDRLKLIAGSRGPGERRGTPYTHPPTPISPPPPSPSPLPSERVRDAGRETAIKLQPRPHGSSCLESLNEIDFVSSGSLRT